VKITDALLFTYGALGGAIQGKTNLQKKLYFMSIILHEDFGYGPHYYGPYSARVAEANQELKAIGFVSESKASGGSLSASGFEIARHDFQLTPDGKTVLDDKKSRLNAEWEMVQKAIERISAAGNLNYVELSIAAKSYFLLDQQGKPARADEIAELAKKFGWTITQEEVSKAVSFLTDLELAAMTA
jgi:uncharacterized protein YwgA